MQPTFCLRMQAKISANRTKYQFSHPPPTRFSESPIWRKFINRLALAVLRTATMTMTLTLTSLINQKNHVTISTFVQVLQYLWSSTRVFKAKYWSTDGEVLEFCGVWWISLSFPDFSRRFFASLAEKIYTFSIAILARFTLSPIPCCSA